jgi:hypothetical protein
MADARSGIAYTDSEQLGCAGAFHFKDDLSTTGVEKRIARDLRDGRRQPGLIGRIKAQQAGDLPRPTTSCSSRIN